MNAGVLHQKEWNLSAVGPCNIQGTSNVSSSSSAHLLRCAAENRTYRAFTLVELLVVIGLIALILILALPALNMARQAARRSRELSAARQVVQAWFAYATDQNGQLLPGFKSGLPAFQPDGVQIPLDTFGGGATIGARWPWRLAPYFGGDMRALYVDEQGELLSQLDNGPREEYLYFASLYPSFGLNSTWVGGDAERMGFLPSTLPSGAPNPLARFYVSRLAGFRQPQRVSVFVSSRTSATVSGQITQGYFRVESPWFVQSQWAPKYDPLDPTSCGNVGAHYRDEAIVATADGAVEAVAIETLRDMRRWADQAQTVDFHLTIP